MSVGTVYVNTKVKMKKITTKVESPIFIQQRSWDRLVDSSEVTGEDAGKDFTVFKEEEKFIDVQKNQVNYFFKANDFS